MGGTARTIVVVLALLCLAALSACGGGNPAPSTPATTSSPDPVAELERLAHRYRSSETTTQAWWVKLPLEEARPLLGTEYQSIAAGQDPSSPFYFVILNGDFTGGDGTTHYDWAVVISYADELTSSEGVVLQTERPDTPGHVWNPLPLSSP